MPEKSGAFFLVEIVDSPLKMRTVGCQSRAAFNPAPYYCVRFDAHSQSTAGSWKFLEIGSGNGMNLGGFVGVEMRGHFKVGGGSSSRVS